MAVKDVKAYYAQVVAQKVALAEDLKDFEEAFKAGHITEDRLEEVKTEFSRLDENVQRLAYIVYLLDEPNRPSKKKKFHKANNDIDKYFSDNNADSAAVLKENESIIGKIKADLKTLIKNK